MASPPIYALYMAYYTVSFDVGVSRPVFSVIASVSHNSSVLPDCKAASLALYQTCPLMRIVTVCLTLGFSPLVIFSNPPAVFTDH